MAMRRPTLVPGSRTGTTLGQPWSAAKLRMADLVASVSIATLIGSQAPDTVFYGDSLAGTLAELAVDDSGTQTNLTVGTGCVHETSTRANFTGERTVDFCASFSNTSTGYLFSYGTSRMELLTTGILRCVRGGVTRDYTITNITGSNAEFMISWSTEANTRLTTGAGDAYRSELHVYNASTGTWEKDAWTHAAHASESSTMLWGARTTAGASAFTGTMRQLRLSRAFHSSTEFSATFVAVPDAPTLYGSSRLQGFVPVRTTGAGHDGEFAGPVYAMAGRAAQQNDRRLWSPIINEICSDEFQQASPYVLTHGGMDTVIHLETLRHRPVPLQCEGMRVRLHFQQTPASSSTLRVFSSNWGGPIVGPPGESYAFEYVEFDYGDNDGTADTGGNWVDFGVLEPVLDQDGYTWLFFGLETTATQWRIRAWNVDPV